MSSNGERPSRLLACGVRVAFWELPLKGSARRYLASLAGTLAPCSAFLPTSRPLAPGRVASLELRVPGEAPVCATAIVLWRSRWGACRGMAVEIVEVDGLGDRRLEDWLQRALACREVARHVTPRLDLSWLGRQWLEHAGIVSSLLPAAGCRPDARHTT